MEDVLAVYERPYDPTAPVICMDEQPVQLVKETRPPIPGSAGRPTRVDYEYERKGTAAIFLFTEPKAGWRKVSVREQRTRLDWAIELRELLEGKYEGVPKVTLIMDNLNIHTTGSLYEAFPPAEARRLVQRLDVHYTPKHGSWLNIAENELSALTRQCLAQRIASLRGMRSQVAAWQRQRNNRRALVRWRFTIDRARERLRRVYPRLQD
jgi:hypothetical protein